MTQRWDCYWYIMVNGKLVRNGNTACWAGVGHCLNNDADYLKMYHGKPEVSGYTVLKPGDSIYISKYSEDETKQYIPLLIATINEITPCELVTVNKEEYIKYTLIRGRDNNLILLNFIRNLWNNPVGDYAVDFFKHLAQSKHEDALARLTEANIQACKFVDYPYGHSNTIRYNKGKIKTKDQLFKWHGTSTKEFLTTD